MTITSIRTMTLLLLLAVSGFHTLAQPSVPALLTSDLEQYHSHHLQEKLFVHTDKESYLTGEICWFRIYAVDGSQHHPLDLSKVAYLEWLDDHNRPVLQTKIPLAKGGGNGSVYLPMTLHSGNYKLRAYTSWMKNSGPDWFFEKPVTIVNARLSAETPTAETPLQYQVSFFPEGGNLVENLPSKIGFRITDQYGRGIDCNGVVTEDDQDTLVRFNTYRFGIGHFPLTPRTGHHYRATFRLADGTAVPQLLPAAYKDGIVMSVTPEGKEQWRVNITSIGQQGEVYLIAQTRQSVKQAEAATLSEGKASFLVARNGLGEGISQLTLFNAARQPVCERLVFNSPSHPLQLAAQTDKETYGTRKKISLRLTATGSDGQPADADCSISVFRLDSLQTAPEEHIDNYLWLASDLKGRIESPGYYFAHQEDTEAIDNLMISHGWRRFRWEEVLRPSAPSFEFPPEYNGAIITAHVTDPHNGLPAKNITGYLSVPGTRTQFTAANTDDEGRLKFELKDFYGGQEVIVQTSLQADSLLKVDVANPFSETYTTNPFPLLRLPAGYAEALTDKSVGVQVLNRYAGEKLKQFRLPVDTNTFYYQPDFSYLLDDYVRFTTMDEVLREFVRLIMIRKHEGHFHFPLFNFPGTEWFAADPLVLLDGVPLTDLDRVMTLDPLKIRKLETVQRRYFLGGTYFDGVVNFVTYKGDLGSYVIDPHATVVDYEGLQLQREFYSPSYATEQDAASHLPDFRNVLYWEPHVSTDSTGKGGLSFYSSDLPGRYLVVIEGLGADGKAGSSVTEFEVK